MDSSDPASFAPSSLAAGHQHRLSEPFLTSSSSSSSPTHIKASSFSKLNAQAPEFVPRVSPSSSSAASTPSLNSAPLLSPNLSATDLTGSFGVPPPPPLRPFYNGYPSPAGLTYGCNTSLQYYNGPGGLLDRRLHRQDVSGFAATLAHAPLQSLAAAQVISDVTPQTAPGKDGHPEDISHKIVNQVEFYFSDANLATTAFLFKTMLKDPEGYVPLSAVASIKKIRTFSKSMSELATILRNSSKLVVSEDGKKIKRQHPLTELDIEEVQSRIVIAENLPEDHCHQNLMKIFSAVGRVKSIRTCQPNGQPSMPKAASTDGMKFSNKVHAFVEYESSELADKAVAELNEDNWRNGLKVRLLLKQTARSAQRQARRTGHDGDASIKEEDANANELDDCIQLLNEPVLGKHTHDKDDGRKAWGHENRENKENRKSGKGHGRGRGSSMNRAKACGVTASVSATVEHPTVSKPPSGPRMPDGTSGFSMGRGKPVAI